MQSKKKKMDRSNDLFDVSALIYQWKYFLAVIEQE